MRAWLILAVVLAGCLPNPVSPKISPNVVSDPKVAAREVWKSYMKKGEFDQAAEVAFNNHLDAMDIEIALRFARLDATEKKNAYVDDKYTENSTALKAAMMAAYQKEVVIACKHEPARSLYTDLVAKDIKKASEETGENSPLYLLLEFDCPINHYLRYEIIEAAAADNSDDYALWQAERANFNSIEKMEFIKIYISKSECSFGFKSASQLGVKPDDMEQLFRLSDCEKEKIDSKEWVFSSELSGRYFASAIRLRKYNLALEFGRLAGEPQNGLWRVVQEAFNSHNEYALNDLLTPHPEIRDPMFAYAIDHGRARFVGMQTKEIIWQQRAFDKLIGEGKYDEAAEVAEFGISETLKKTGILIAFRATMAAGNFEHGRFYFKERYPKIVTTDEYHKAADAWFEAHPGEKRRALPLSKESKRKALSKPVDPNCVPAKPGEWSVKRC